MGNTPTSEARLALELALEKLKAGDAVGALEVVRRADALLVVLLLEETKDASTV